MHGTPLARRAFAVCGAIVMTIAVFGCAHHDDDPQALADTTTRAVYDADYDRTTADFDDALKAQVTRASLGDLSDKLHALGAYHGLKPARSDPDRGRYVYDAAFDKGTMTVELRIDPTHKIGAYRIAPAKP